MWQNKSTLLMTFVLASIGFNLLSSNSLQAVQKSTSQTEAKLNEQADVSDSLSLKKIMANPDWMGNSPTNPVWSHDSSNIFYAKKAKGHSHQEYFKIQLPGQEISQLAASDMLNYHAQRAEKNSAESQGVFIYQDDVYWTNFTSGTIRALTADAAKQSGARFISDNKLSYLQGHKVFIYDLRKGYAQQVADFKTQADPDKKNGKTYLEQSQLRLLKYVEKTQAEKKFQKERQKKNRVNKDKTWYLGAKVEIRTFQLSPDGNWLVLGTVEKGASAKPDYMPEFVSANGYVKNRKVRALVGTQKPTDETFYLFDLKQQQKYSLDTSNLPGINDDPLDSLKKKAAKKIGYKYKELQQPRAVYASPWSKNGGVEWTKNSQQVALQLFSYDNKDRWIVGLDVAKRKLKTLHWMSDEAWINKWAFNEFGWLADNQTLYYLSEEEGYSHIYIKKGRRRARQLTEGEFEVSKLTLGKNGDYIYFSANKKHPGIYEVYRVSLKGGKVEPLTDLGGVNNYQLSPSEKQLALLHSDTTHMPELYLQEVASSIPAKRLTDSASEAFKAVKWQAPEIIKVASSHIDGDVYSRYYAPQTGKAIGKNNQRPAVIFVHGAGYLQNSHQGWSGYFREYMFHNLLTRQGYAVLDMDYRASKGYGRDWRTAIYRNMGTPELQDLKDGVNWLVENASVDPERVGVYGGSYGGFMTFMALFKEPELFAAGAALRPVTDWAHYNHGYTSNILNTPQVDPEAFEVSSPIEFAEGLNKPLLIAHGMVDDNVFFKDSVRLVQRLIELEKTEYFETAVYPVEPHGFKQPSSWLDEYRRIYRLFEQHLN